MVFAFAVSLASAAVGVTIAKTTEITPNQNGTITITNTGNATEGITLVSQGDFTVSFSDNGFSLAPSTNKVITVSPIDLGKIGFGGKSTVITAHASDGTEQTEANLTMTVSGSFCSHNEVGGNLEITSVEIENNGEGDETEWHLLDTIEVEVEVENVGDDDIEDVMVEIGLFDKNGKNIIGDVDFTNSEEEEMEVGDLDDGDEETVIFSFKVPADFESGNYKLAVKAYSDDLGESKECTETSKDLEQDDRYTEIEVERENDEGKFIAFDNIEFMPSDPTCGETITMTLDVFNIGDEDQNQVKVNLVNSELGINEFVEIRNDLDQGDEETVSFVFTIPQNAQNKVYSLLLSAEYDYKNGNYREESEDDTIVTMKLNGCGVSGSESDIVVINARLLSDEVVAGQEVVVRATISSLKTEKTNFAVSATGYQNWASLDSSTQFAELSHGESKDLLFTFTIDKNADGEQSFEIQVRDNNNNVETKEVVVYIEGTSQGGSLFGGLGDNTFLWIIGAVNLVLVILIIIVAVRVARR